MKGQLEIVFHNPNEKEEMANYLSGILADMLVKKALEEPKKFWKEVTRLVNGGELENSSLLQSVYK